MKQVKEKVIITPGTAFEIKPNSKYLIIMPKDAKLKRIASEMAKFFAPTPVFMLAVNDVTDIKIAELIEEGGQGG